MKCLYLTIFIALVFQGHVSSAKGYEKVESKIYTLPTQPADKVEKYENAGLFHSGNQINMGIKNLKATINRDAGKVAINFDYPKPWWFTGSCAYPIQIRFYDKNGQPITHIRTGEDYVPKEVYVRTKPGTYNRAFLDTRPEFKQKKAELLKKKNNEIVYAINQRDAAYATKVLVGFLTTTKTRTCGPLEEFMPEKFFEDWSSKEVFGIKEAKKSQEESYKKYVWQYYYASEECHENAGGAQKSANWYSNKVQSQDGDKLVVKKGSNSSQPDLFYTSLNKCKLDNKK